MNGNKGFSNWRLKQELVFPKLQETPLLFASPMSIRFVVPKTNLVGFDWMQSKEFFEYFIVGGEWHKSATLFEEERDFRLILDLDEKGQDFEASDLFRTHLDDVKNGTSLKGFNGVRMRSYSDVLRTFEYYHNLLMRIKSQGYRQSVPPKERYDQVGIIIGKTGEYFHFRTGHHRLSIAKILEIPKIPIWVHGVHEDWLQSQSEYDPSNEEQSIVSILTRISREEQ